MRQLALETENYEKRIRQGEKEGNIPKNELNMMSGCSWSCQAAAGHATSGGLDKDWRKAAKRLKYSRYLPRSMTVLKQRERHINCQRHVS